MKGLLNSKIRKKTRVSCGLWFPSAFCVFLLLILVVGNMHRAHAQLYSLTSEDFLIYFPSNGFAISSSQKKKLSAKILEIGSTNIKEIYVEGHTDSFATDEYNLGLAARRADATVDVLKSIGVPERFIKRESFGETQLVSENQSNNRRAKVYFVYETDLKSTLYPPKYIVIKTIDKKTNKPIRASLGFDYKDLDMKFSSIGKSGVSSTFEMLSEDLEISASSVGYLSEYLAVPLEDIEKPIDTLVYTIPLRKVRITGKFTFNNIYFHTDSDKIKPESEPDLHKLLAVMQRNKAAYIEIQGHMNYPVDRPMNSIQDRYNKELSFKRAKAINDYLVTSGIKQERLTYKGMGNSRMKFKLPASRAEEDQNKRVEIYTLKEV